MYKQTRHPFVITANSWDSTSKQQPK